ncbi:LPS export ABC transporter ATP-binding protein [Candidatus Bipolaricaulota bacterium]|nr:LPS export ABC transporter ATP-binding protein [Candidatus Bipolaricaulota bacterium]
MLEAANLVKHYQQRCVVDHLSLRVSRGEIIGLLGPNGAGKTTTFRMMVGFIGTEQGSVTLDGRNLASLPFHQRARMGVSYLPQEPSIFVKATVADNLNLVLEWTQSRNEMERTRQQLLEEFALTSLQSHLASTLSSGERRRLEIARALATSPSFILLDEPFSGIDPLTIHDLQGCLNRLKEQQIGFVITDHNVRDTLAVTDYTYLIHEGKIIVEGTADELVTNPLARQFYLGSRFRL